MILDVKKFSYFSSICLIYFFYKHLLESREKLINEFYFNSLIRMTLRNTTKIKKSYTVEWKKDFFLTRSISNPGAVWNAYFWTQNGQSRKQFYFIYFYSSIFIFLFSFHLSISIQFYTFKMIKIISKILNKNDPNSQKWLPQTA